MPQYTFWPTLIGQRNETLIHEMIHYWLHITGKYNKFFKRGTKSANLN